ncbi:reverse transcriptase domain-containing protein [Tanacetum coccineum]
MPKTLRREKESEALKLIKASNHGRRKAKHALKRKQKIHSRTWTYVNSRPIRRIQDFEELKDHCLTLKNTSYPHQRYTVYNTLVNEEEPTGFTSIGRIHQEDTAYVFRVPPYSFDYPKRRLTMEEVLAKYIDEGKHKHEEMEIFIKEFRTTNELLLKERINLVSELKIGVKELSKVIGNVLIPKNKVKGMTTRGGKMTSKATRSKEINETGINKNGPPRFEQDVQEKPHDDKSSSIPERTTQPLVKPQQLSISFSNRGMEKSINQSDLESCNSIGDEFDNNSNDEMSIRRIDPVNTSYSEAHQTEGTDRVKNKHLYSASINEIDEKEPELKDLPSQLEYAYLHVLEKRKGVEDLATDHLFRIEDPHMEVLTKREIADEFPNNYLMLLKSKFNDDGLWYADFVNYIVGKVVPPNWTFEKRKRFFSQVKTYFWEEPYAFKLCADNIMRRCVPGSETLKILAHCHSGPTGGHHSALVMAKKVYESGFYWPSVFKYANEYVRRCDACQRSGNISSRNEMPQNNIQVCEVFDVWGLDFMGPFPDSIGNKYYYSCISVQMGGSSSITYRMVRVVVKFLRGLFARFGVPKALISDRGHIL